MCEVWGNLLLLGVLKKLVVVFDWQLTLKRGEEGESRAGSAGRVGRDATCLQLPSTLSLRSSTRQLATTRFSLHSTLTQGLSMTTVILDNGAYSIKAGLASAGPEPRSVASSLPLALSPSCLTTS